MKFGNWSDAPCYYVTCKDAGRTGWLSGPYQTPEDALADVRQVSALAKRHDLWAAFYAFGISRRSTGRRVGLLNPPENIALQCGRSMQMRERGLAPDDYLSIGVGD